MSFGKAIVRPYIFLILQLCLFSVQLLAQSHSYCEPTEPIYQRQVQVPGRPNYFFRAFPESDALGYASSDGNFIFEMTSGKQYQLPGIYDPVPVGEQVISIPSYDDGMYFYPVSEILKGNKSPVPLARASKLLGVYQSVGLVSRTDQEEIYGVIVAASEDIAYQQVKVTWEPELKVEVLDSVRPLCKGMDIKLPMISKDAKEISGRDMSDGLSKVWQINFEDGKCREVENLGLDAGKVDFSYDGRYLAFHLQADGRGDGSFFRHPGDFMSMNAYLFDRHTKRVTKVSSVKPGENAYFPVYRKDGTVVYAVDKKGIAWFVQMDPRDLKTKELSMNGDGYEEELPALLAMGRLWNDKCFPDHPLKTVESLLGAAITLTPEKCEALIHDNWEKISLVELAKAEVKDSANGKLKYDSEKIKNLTWAELKQTCEFLKP